MSLTGSAFHHYSMLFWKKGGGTSTEGAEGCGCPLPTGRDLGKGLCPSPEQNFIFGAQNR